MLDISEMISYCLTKSRTNKYDLLVSMRDIVGGAFVSKKSCDHMSFMIILTLSRN